jgi:flagellar biosynthesis protein FlhA
VFGLPAVWIKAAEKEHAQVSGYTVVDTTTIMATHISEIIKKHAHELWEGRRCSASRQSRRKLPKVVDELVPGS